MKRQYCEACKYPQRVCICHAVAPIDVQCELHIIQHPKEVNSAKNTARLVKLCVPSARIWQGESPEDLLPLKAHLQTSCRTVLLLYPGEGANDLAEWLADQKKNSKQGVNASDTALIVVDATWKKAYKLWQLNEWLQSYPRITLPKVISDYRIRKVPEDGYLSTLEAIVVALNYLDDCNTAPLLASFDAMQRHYEAFSGAQETKANSD